MDEARTNAKDRRVSKIPRSRTLAKITQRNRVTSGKENDPPQPASHVPGLFKKLKQPAQDVHRGSRGGKPPRPTMKHARSLEDLKSSKEQTSISVQSAVQKPGVGVPQAASYQELKRLCHKLSQEQAARCEEVAATEKKMAAVKEEMVHMQSMLNHAQQRLEESLREHKAASDALSVVSAERDAYLMLLERNAVDVQSGEMVVSRLKAASEDREIQLQVDAFQVALEELLQMCQEDTAALKVKTQSFKETVAAM